MGLDRKKFTYHKEGEIAAAAGEVYYGGSPAAIDQNGKLVLATSGRLEADKSDATSISYVGVFFNTSTVDSLDSDNLATFLPGDNVLTFIKLELSNLNQNTNPEGGAGVSGDDFPYDSTLDWTAGDYLYIGTDGKWTNVDPGSASPIFGTVLAVGADYLTVLVYSGPCQAF